jgi:peptidoglycan/LPS O-acetylase OafA/YrhL
MSDAVSASLRAEQPAPFASLRAEQPAPSASLRAEQPAPSASLRAEQASTATDGSRLPALDAVRAIGAIGVLAYHVGFNTGLSAHGTWNGLLARLDVGVALFFVLSGFLLFRPFALAAATGRDRPSTPRYLWRRAVRILPAYWLTVAVCLTVLPQNRPAPLSDWVHHVTLTQIYDFALVRHGLTQTWSLATEVAFYLVLPLVALAAVGRRWRPGRALAVAAAGATVSGIWVAGMALGYLDMRVHTMWLPAYAIWFSAGIALATAHVALSTGTAPASWRVLADLARAPLACWVAAVALLAIAASPLAGPRDLVEPTAAQFGAKLAIYAVIASLIMLPVAFGPPGRLHSALGSPLASWIGTISYGLFLWHPFVIDLIFLTEGRSVFSGDFLGTLGYTLLGATVLASLSYYGLERPLQRWAARWSRRRGATVTESHSAVALTSAAA